MCRTSRSADAGAFTLVEVLVAVAVLALLVFLLGQIVGSASRLIGDSGKHLDADSQARLVFERMGLDFGRLVNRPDVDAYFCSRAATGGAGVNDAFFFYSEVSGYNDGTVPDSASLNTLSLVGYQIDSSYRLARLGKPLDWGGSGIAFLASAPGVPPSPARLPGSLADTWGGVIPNIADPASWTDTVDFLPLGHGVFRMQFCYLMNDCSYSLPGNAYASPASGTSSQIVDLRNVSAVVVAIAVLDEQSRKMLPGFSPSDPSGVAPSMASLAAALPNVSSFAGSPPVLMADSWTAAVNQPGFAGRAGVPAAVAAKVRIYQRAFYVNQTAPITP
ncbi:MAG TPA: hypothetical protein VIM58_12255 [Candidatus Methylacidiphilales bacterium]